MMLNLRRLRFGLLVVIMMTATLFGCSGSGSCNNCVNPAPTPTPAPESAVFSVLSATEYPSSVASTPYVTIANNSTTNINNLTYSVPSATNYTGVSIVINPNGAGENCSSIPAGTSCTFTVSIPAGSHPGSFVVVANYIPEKNTVLIASKIPQVQNLTLSTNLSLVDIPPYPSQVYILPNEQTIHSIENESTVVYISLFMQSYILPFTTLKLVDATGAELSNYKVLGSLATSAGSVNTYAITIPAGKSVQQVQALLYNTDQLIPTCSNSGFAPYCSNQATIYLESANIGILSAQPNYFTMSSSYESQVVVLNNTGTESLTELTLPVVTAPFNISSNNCADTLGVGNSCSFIINYIPSMSSGVESLVISYNNGQKVESSIVEIAYTGTALITLNPSSSGDVMIGNTFQFNATISGSGASVVTAAFINPILGVISSLPAPCTLSTSGSSQSCTFTVVSNWNTGLANSLSLGAQIYITTSNNVKTVGSPVLFSELTPAIYLPQSGQTPTAPVVATSAMDGYNPTGIAWAYSASGSTTPNPRFSIGTGGNANCITDNLTGLMWIRDLNTVYIKQANLGESTIWQNALDSITSVNANSGYCGYKDWHLPTINQLSSLLNAGLTNTQSQGSAWLIPQGFMNVNDSQTAGAYWSSTSLGANPESAIGVDFYSGIAMVLAKSSPLFVWPVRVAQ
jgi:hypothetical protein